ncbi:acyl-CoA dehydrogenase family protein [Aeromicrobium sp.]|uniref:acyl-CoA dehydrogenase family protein n=1 Tax=Aeromicrobium sp. TaxID=1871063 RepID=UPI003C6B2DD5
MTLSPEHESFRRTVREFAESEIAPHVAGWDREHHFPIDAVRAMGKLGLFGITAPEEYGGADGDFTSLCVAIEELGRVDQSIGITLEAAVGLGINPILTFGTHEQKERWLPDLVSGHSLAAFGLTEPGSGSDAGGIRTKATLDESTDEWVLNGAKQFITNSGSEMTSLITVAARTGNRPDGRAEVSAIIVPADTPGLEVGPAYDKLGWHISDTHPLSFDDARVPADHLLGERGRGYAQFLSTLDDGRIAIAALAVGCIQACLDLCVEYAGERTTLNDIPIGQKQGVAFPIADLAVMAEAGRALTYQAAALKDTGASHAELKRVASIAKLYTSEAAVAATRVATQVFGGYGFMEEYPVARFYRDAKILEIGEGTSEVQRILIARSLGLPAE